MKKEKTIKNKSDRKLYLDFLKILACFLVIVNHAGGFVFTVNNLGTTLFYTIFFCICKVAVGIFIMITGALLLKAETDYKTILKRIIRILIPLIGLSFVTYYLNNGFDIVGFFKDFISNPINTPYWYLYMLVGLYLVTPFCQKMVSSFNDKDYINFIIITLLLPAFVSTLQILFSFSISSWFLISVFSKNIGLYVTGYYLSKCECNKRVKDKLILCYIVSLILNFAVIFIPYLKSGSISYDFDSYDTLFSIISAISIFYVFRYYFESKKFKEISKKIIISTSGVTFGIYLIHYVIISKIYNLNLIKAIFNFNNFIGVIFLEMITFIFCGLVIYILKKVPFIKKFL